jgi:hypothetical protein
VNHLEAALLEVVQFLEERNLEHMVVGGFATLHWGRPRLTRDLDLVVEVTDAALDSFLEEVTREFRLQPSMTPDFVRRNHLLRMQTRSEVPVDLMIAFLPWLRSAIRRGVPVSIGPRTVRLSSPEDLILMKLASERSLDHADVEGVILRQRDRLDRSYLERHLRDLAAGLERPEVLALYEGFLRKAGGKGGHHG